MRVIVAVGLVFVALFFENCQTKNKNPTVRWFEIKHSFGEVKRHDTLFYKFAVVNESSESLYILNVKGSCECTSIDWTSSSLVKGDTGYIKVHYVPEKIGFSTKTIVVETNTTTPLTVLSIEADVKE